MSRAYRGPINACVRAAADQYGVLTVRQAFDAGLSIDAIRRLVQDGAWTRVLPGTYSLWTPKNAELRRRQRLMAGTFWLGEGSGISHRAAAGIWSLDGVRAITYEFSTTGRRRKVLPGLVVHHVSGLAADLVVVDGLIVTSVARTLLDMASVLATEALESAFESALRLRLVSIGEIREALRGASRTHAGKGPLRRLLEDHPVAHTESELETRVWQLMRAGKLPIPVRQHVVHDRDGRFVARIDFAYPAARLAVEADGYAFHSNRRDWRRDRARRNALARLGWTVYCVTWEDVVKRRSTVVREIAELLAGASRRERSAVKPG